MSYFLPSFRDASDWLHYRETKKSTKQSMALYGKEFTKLKKLLEELYDPNFFPDLIERDYIRKELDKEIERIKKIVPAGGISDICYFHKLYFSREMERYYLMNRIVNVLIIILVDFVVAVILSFFISIYVKVKGPFRDFRFQDIPEYYNSFISDTGLLLIIIPFMMVSLALFVVNLLFGKLLLKVEKRLFAQSYMASEIKKDFFREYWISVTPGIKK